MTITRDGKEIILTGTEIERAYREQEWAYTKMDAEMRSEEAGYAGCMDGDDYGALARRFLEDYQSCDCADYDAWMANIEDYARERGIKKPGITN